MIPVTKALAAPLSLFPPSQSTANANRSELDNLLQVLLRIAENSKGGNPPGAEENNPDRWEDEEYLYLEARLTEAQMDFDISVHDDRLLIRIVK